MLTSDASIRAFLVVPMGRILMNATLAVLTEHTLLVTVHLTFHEL